MPPKLRLTALTLAIACAPPQFEIPPTPGVEASARRMLGTASPGATTPLSAADQRWVDRTLASLTLREKIGQLIMPWVGGDYASVGSPEFEQVRKWVQDDRVGGLVLSIGLPLSYAAKPNELQSRAKVPFLIASDMENGPGMRLGNICALPSLLGHKRPFSGFVEKFALSGKPIIVLSFGSPYLLSAFPSVSSYLLAWGGAPVSQHAAALAVLGEREINGHLPITLPPSLPFGAGIHRAPTRM